MGFGSPETKRSGWAAQASRSTAFLRDDLTGVTEVNLFGGQHRDAVMAVYRISLAWF